MAIRCPSCNKFASPSEPEVEDSTFEIDGEQVQVTVEVFRNSECCGDEILRGTLEGSFLVPHDCPNADIVGREVYHQGETFEIEAGFDDEHVEGEMTAYNTDGKKAVVGAEGNVTVRCLACGEECEVVIDSGDLEMAAAELEESV